MKLPSPKITSVLSPTVFQEDSWHSLDDSYPWHGNFRNGQCSEHWGPLPPSMPSLDTLCWAFWWEDNFIIRKQMLFGELPQGTRSKAFKDYLMNRLESVRFQNRNGKIYHVKRKPRSKEPMKEWARNVWSRMRRLAGGANSVDPAFRHLVCEVCSRLCMSHAGQVNHLKCYAEILVTNYNDFLIGKTLHALSVKQRV